jgi:protein phosphatase
VARERFGVLEGEQGICYTRTGRRFFENNALENELLSIIGSALDRSQFWERFKTDWVCLDCELMPWSAKAIELVRQQYASVGTAARVGLGEAVSVLEHASGRGMDVAALVESIRDIRVAPFHIMATEGTVHSDTDHVWHMAEIAAVVGNASELLLATPYQVVDLSDGASEAAATAWWTDLTAKGGEGAVVKPLSFVATGSRGLLQPAIKCRGREYLRIIYGPEYTLPQHLSRLRERGLSGKRSLALREFALGIEGLERFVQMDSAIARCSSALSRS